MKKGAKYKNKLKLSLKHSKNEERERLDLRVQSNSMIVIDDVEKNLQYRR